MVEEISNGTKGEKTGCAHNGHGGGIRKGTADDRKILDRDGI